MYTNFNVNNFTVLKGGLAETSSDSRKVFKEAYITDTRLMGVTVLYIHWELPDNMLKKHFYQFFHFDAEEYGLDEYHSVIAESPEAASSEVSHIELMLSGNLGAKKNMLTEREALFLVQEYVEFNRTHSIPLPGEEQEIEFLLSPHIEFSDVERYVLMCKQSVMLNSPYQVINYFIMRCVGRDFTAAKFLTKNYVRTDLFPELPPATLLKNVIDEDNDDKSGSNTDYYATDDSKDFGTFQTRKSFLCESLIGFGDKFFDTVTRVTLDHLNVVKYERISSFAISPWEASMILSAPEYVSVYDMLIDGIDVAQENIPLLSRTLPSERECGKLFMIFYPHNDHVSKQTFRMSDDVFAVCYVLDSGQIVLSSSDRLNLSALEQDFMRSDISPLLVHIAKYAFDNPVMAEFISSGFEDFEDFADIISRGGNEDGY